MNKEEFAQALRDAASMVEEYGGGDYNQQDEWRILTPQNPLVITVVIHLDRRPIDLRTFNLDSQGV